MKIYRVSYDGDPDGHKGYSFFASKAEATKDAKRWERQDQSPGYTKGIGDHRGKIEALDIDPSKRGIIRALNTYAGHCDNG